MQQPMVFRMSSPNSGPREPSIQERRGGNSAPRTEHDYGSGSITSKLANAPGRAGDHRAAMQTTNRAVVLTVGGRTPPRLRTMIVHPAAGTSKLTTPRPSPSANLRRIAIQRRTTSQGQSFSAGTGSVRFFSPKKRTIDLTPIGAGRKVISGTPVDASMKLRKPKSPQEVGKRVVSKGQTKFKKSVSQVFSKYGLPESEDGASPRFPGSPQTLGPETFMEDSMGETSLAAEVEIRSSTPQIKMPQLGLEVTPGRTREADPWPESDGKNWIHTPLSKKIEAEEEKSKQLRRKAVERAQEEEGEMLNLGEISFQGEPKGKAASSIIKAYDETKIVPQKRPPSPKGLAITEQCTIPCPYCEEKFATIFRMKLHRGTKHKEECQRDGIHVGPRYKKHPINSPAYLVPCDFCTKKFRTVQSMKNHRTRNHRKEIEQNPEVVMNIPCPFGCGFMFSKDETKRAHIRKIHNLDENYQAVLKADETETFPCEICMRTYTKESSLKTHIRRVHDNPEYRPGGRRGARTWSPQLTCGLCYKIFTSQDFLIKHLIGSPEDGGHDLALTVESAVFNSVQEFEMWRLQVEAEGGFEFVNRSGNFPASARKHEDAKGQVWTHGLKQCHRSKAGSSQTTTRRSRKNPKLDFTCSAFCSYKICQGKVFVKYCLNHYKHGPWIKISSTERPPPQLPQLMEIAPPVEREESVYETVNVDEIVPAPLETEVSVEDLRWQIRDTLEKIALKADQLSDPGLLYLMLENAQTLERITFAPGI